MKKSCQPNNEHDSNTPNIQSAIRNSISVSQQEITELLFSDTEVVKKPVGIKQVESPKPKKRKRCVIS